VHTMRIHDPHLRDSKVLVAIFCLGLVGCATNIEPQPQPQLDVRVRTASGAFVLCVQQTQKQEAGKCGRALYENLSALSDNDYKIGALRIAEKCFGLLNRLATNPVTDAQYQEAAFKIRTDFVADMLALQDQYGLK